MPETTTKPPVAEEEELEEKQAEPKAPSKLAGIIKIAVIILGIQIAVAAGAFMVVKSFIVPRVQSAASEKEGKKQTESEKAEETPREVKLIENIIINPAGTNGTRYLSTSIGLELVKTPEMEKLMEEKTPVIRDILIAILTSKTLEELSSPAGKEDVRNEISEKISVALEPHKVFRIYFVDYVLQ